LINQRDVIRMRILYLSISAKLAVSSHMYICKEANNGRYEYVKCQTLKPNMLTGNMIRHFVDEEADICRNPFQRTTRIDCDKLFTTDTVEYGDELKTTARPDVCKELYDEVIRELYADGYDTIKMDEDELVSINPMITK